jgi:hypothetical protein
MPDVNPYTSPDNSEDVILAQVVDGPQSTAGLYRKGDQLVMHKNAYLPARCVKSNQPVEGRRLQRNLSWYHPLLYLALLASPLVFIILAYVLRKQATVYLGLSEPWFCKRRLAILIAWMMGVLGVVIMVASIVIVSDPQGRTPWVGWGILLGIVVILAAAIYGSAASQMVRPVRITDDYIWLKGVHPDFLADLPPWPYRP